MELIDELSTDLVKVLANADGVAVLQLNRPQKRNAFTQAMIDTIVTALDRIDKNRAVRALVVTSSPGSPFCGEFFERLLNPRLWGFREED